MRSLTLVLAFLSISALSAKDIQMIGGGKSNVAIVVEDPKNVTIALAGVELALHLEMRTGVKAPIIGPDEKCPDGMFPFYLGLSDRTRKLGCDETKIGEDGYFLKVTDKYAVIAGRDKALWKDSVYGHHFISCNYEYKIFALGETGTQNGVYKFLEHFAGVRWYMPGDLGIIVPKSDSFAVPETELYDAPAFCFRQDYGMYFRDAKYENLINYKRQCFGASKNIFINHSFHRMLKFKDSHPEYFALIDGKRDFTNLSTANNYGNLCMSNPEAAKAFAGLAAEWFKAHPEMDVFAVVPQDGMHRVCECPNCKKLYSPHLGENGKHSNLVFHFVKEIANELKKTNPDKYIGALAYEGYQQPPEFQMPSNVIVRICYTVKGLRNPARKEEVRNNILGFEKMGVKISTWTYGLFDHIPPFRGLPIFYPELLQEDIRFWRDHSVMGEFFENEYRSGGGDTYVHTPDKVLQGISHINEYVHSHLLWNPDLDLKALLDEYYTLFYGPAAAQMRKFWETSRDTFMKANEKSPLTQYTKDDIEGFYKILDEAQAAAGSGNLYAQRIAKIRSELDQFMPQLITELSYKKIFSVAKIKGDINIEDAPADGAWSYATKYTLGKRDGRDIDKRFATEVRAVANDKGLGLYCFAKEPEMDKLVTKTTKRDDGDTWLDDCLEIYIITEDRTVNLLYIITAAGNIFDYRRNADVNLKGDLGWSSDLTLKVDKKADAIEYRMFIPWSDLRYGGWFPNMKFQLYRRRTGGDPKNGDYYSLFPVLEFHNYSPDTFPFMQFFSEESMLFNGDFEEVTPDGKPAGWNNKCQLHQGDVDAYSGKNCVAMIRDEKNKVLLDYTNSNKFDVKGGSDYILRFHHKGAAGYQYVRFFDKNGKNIPEPRKPFYYCVASKDWQLVTNFGRIPEDAVKCEIVLRTFTPPPVYFDKVQFYSCKP